VTESFVDLSYRGLSLGRRIKLTQVRPSSGYLEHPTPMPVGTPIAIATDEGMALQAVVTHVHEQVGGSDRLPGMTVKPALADHKLTAWWAERVTLPEQDPPRRIERSRPVTVRPRTHTVQTPPPPAAVAGPAAAPALEPVDPGEDRKTSLMNAVDQELLEQLTRSPQDLEDLTGGLDEDVVVDDGKRTTIMEAVDTSALGLDTSGSMPAVDDHDGDDGDDGAEGTDDAAAGSEGGAERDAQKPQGSVKRRKKRR
jgi:hypothetical protein